MSKEAVILVNVGSPKSYQASDVGSYLQEFLMDEDVISLPYALRWILVNLLIVPRRSQVSAKKYQMIWKEGESPLILNTRKGVEKMREQNSGEVIYEWAMRYGEPSLASVLQKLRAENVSHLKICPMFPQYAEATTGSVKKEVSKVLMKMNWSPKTQILKPFFVDPTFLSAFIRQFQQYDLSNYDHVLFSFHSLPESQVKKTPGCLTSANCCDQESACAKNCYRAQCLATARSLALQLKLPPEKWSSAFQSRIRGSRWMGPFTDQTAIQLAQSGAKKLLIVCPSFVADCLETIEEIDHELRQVFLQAGGEQFDVVSCPNDESLWMSDLLKLTQLDKSFL